MNQKIYVGQESLDLILNTNTDLSTASNLKVKYKKPDDSTGSWTATLYNTTYIKKAFIAAGGELDQAGTWTFWAYATMSDGREIPGDPAKVTVREQGS